MNPLRYGDGHCNGHACSMYQCLFQHETGKQKPERKIRDIEQRFGDVRCPYEWEISAVKP